MLQDAQGITHAFKLEEVGALRGVLQQQHHHTKGDTGRDYEGRMQIKYGGQPESGSGPRNTTEREREMNADTHGALVSTNSLCTQKILNIDLHD